MFRLFNNKPKEQWKDHLLVKRKLLLLVDLDLTIIRRLPKVAVKNNLKPDFTVGEKLFFKRPNLYEFLQELDPLYEFVLATKSKPGYAKAVLEMVDREDMFDKRILASDRFKGDKLSFLPYLDPVDESVIVVIDDTPIIWRQKPYVIEVKEYDPTEKDKDYLRCIENGRPVSQYYLNVLAHNLALIHEAFYKQYDLDKTVKTEDILTTTKAKVLNKCNIWLKSYQTDDTLEDLIDVLGASVYKIADVKSPTHIVARIPEDIPEEIRQKFIGVKVVTEEWISQCALCLVHLDEKQFLLS